MRSLPPALPGALSLRQLLAHLGISRNSYFRYIVADPSFPPKRQFPGNRRVYWVRSEVDAWLKAQSPVVPRRTTAA
jgi:predicted DNA-binding transcriptional regulator AlpA